MKKQSEGTDDILILSLMRKTERLSMTANKPTQATPSKTHQTLHNNTNNKINSDARQLSSGSSSSKKEAEMAVQMSQLM